MHHDLSTHMEKHQFLLVPGLGVCKPFQDQCPQNLKREEASFAKESGGRVEAVQAKLQAAKQVMHHSLALYWLPLGHLHASAIAGLAVSLLTAAPTACILAPMRGDAVLWRTQARRQLQTPVLL